MRSGAVFFLLAAAMSCWWMTAPRVSADVEIALEAELANAIVEPMVIATPDDAEAMGGPRPSEPSHGRFVWTPGPPATGAGNNFQGHVEFNIDIPEAGKYAVWVYVTAWDGDSDSAFATWLPADPDENPQVTRNNEFRWQVLKGPDWHWDRVNRWLNAGVFDAEWKLPKGETTLRIWTREDATMFDTLFITDALSDDPAIVGVRLPTGEDVQFQEEGFLVQSGWKLPVTWAKLKEQ